MRLIKLEFEGDDLYNQSLFSMDLYATDRVVPGKDGSGLYGIAKVGTEGNLYTQSVIGISGVNASGKTTSINLLEFAARYLGISYAMRSDRFSWETVPAKLRKNFGMRAIFWHEGRYYALLAALERGDQDERAWYRIDDEHLYQLKVSHPAKNLFASFRNFIAHAKLVIHRNALEGEPGSLTQQQKTFLRDDMSIVFAVTGNRVASARVAVGRLSKRTYDTAVVNAFDNSIEYLRWDSSSEVYRLKFRGEEARTVSRNAAEAELSTGTIFGSELVLQAISTLNQGGIMIVDEIERGLNKSLVRAIMQLFFAAPTNPHGAQLIFTTHYAELLDYLPRKDDVYLLVRDGSYRTSVIKYSDRVKRIENKKSEVVLSNFIKGTMPNYPDVRDLRVYVQNSVKDDAGE